MVMNLDDYVPKEFPKAKYHATENPRVVNDSDEEALLGASWVDHPSDVVKELPELTVNPIPEVVKEAARRGRPPNPPKVAE